MSDERNMSLRDETLIKVLERLADSISSQESLLKEAAKKQHELYSEMESIERRQLLRQNAAVSATERSSEAISRYRSDMLSLVNEQDRMNEIITELNKKQLALAYSQDNIINMITDINGRIQTQEKTVGGIAYSQESSKNTLTDLSSRIEMQERVVNEINTHSVRHEELLPKEIGALNRSIGKLHADTEKRIVELQRETQKQLDKMKLDYERRLLALDKIEAALEILMIRTEPPEKKPFFIIRFARWIRRSFRSRRIHNKEKAE